MVRKKWGPGNPLYDWKMRHKTGARKRGGGSMVRHRRRGGFKRGGKGNVLMKGLLGSKVPFGLLGLVGAGFLYAKFVSPSVPKVIPSIAGVPSSAIEAGIAGGVPAAVGAYLAGKMEGGATSGSTSDSGIKLYG